MVSALVLVVRAQCVFAGGTGCAVFRAEVVGTDIALLGMVGAGGRLTDSALDAISRTGCLPARLTGSEVVGSERIGTDLTVAAMVATQRVAAPCAVGCVIRAEYVTACPARCGIGFADAVVTRGARHEVRIGEVVDADHAG